MNSDGLPSAASRTSGLAIASLVLGLLGCLCLPAPAALICGIVALVQMGKDPLLKGKGLAIAGIVLGLLSVPLAGIGAAVAIPNFIKFQARSKQSECKAQLRALATMQRSIKDEGGYTDDVSKLGFSPGPGARYAYLLSASPEFGKTAVLGDHASALGEDDVMRELDRPLAGDVTLGVDAESFTAICVGNVDNDEVYDVWSVSSQDRVGPSGNVPAFQPFNDWDDISDGPGR